MTEPRGSRFDNRRSGFGAGRAGFRLPRLEVVALQLLAIGHSSPTHSSGGRLTGDRIAIFLLHCTSPLLAQSRHKQLHRTCPLSGVKRTCAEHHAMSANDPKRTSGCILALVPPALRLLPHCRSRLLIPGNSAGCYDGFSVQVGNVGLNPRAVYLRVS